MAFRMRKLFGTFEKRLPEAPAKRSQHVNATYRNIVGCNMFRAFGHRVAMCCDMLGVVDSNLKWSNLSQQHPACRNTSQHGGQTHATCCAQQCLNEREVVWSQSPLNSLSPRTSCLFLLRWFDTVFSRPYLAFTIGVLPTLPYSDRRGNYTSFWKKIEIWFNI